MIVYKTPFFILLGVEGQSMVNIEALYSDKEFTDFVVYNAQKNLLEYDDLHQSCMLEILDSEAKTIQDCKRAVWRVVKRMKKYDIKHRGYSYIDGYDLGPDETEDPKSVLWEDNHMVGF